MTGNIIVSTCCLGDMAVNAPSSSGCALGLGGGGGGGGVYSHITLANMCYLLHSSLVLEDKVSFFFESSNRPVACSPPPEINIAATQDASIAV